MSTPGPRQQIGAESRGNLLPTAMPSQQSAFGTLGPNYDYASELVLPGDIGVRRAGTLSAVIDGIKGVNYYMDAIAFGQSSNPMTRGMPFQRYGINYFIKTGTQCSNGADMYSYIDLIPKGDALGKNFQRGMKSVGFDTELRGLAPGIIEDAKAGMDPVALMKPLFGTGYSHCKKITKRVGDEAGRIKDSEGNSWVDDPRTVEYIGGLPYQTKWVRDRDIDAEEWSNEPKTMNPDGSPVQESFIGYTDKGYTNFVGESFINFQKPDKFLDEMSLTQLLKIASILLIANIAVYKYRY